MSNIPIRIAIDISGVPPETTYIGLASFNAYEFNEFEKRFKSKFPNHFRSRWKGAKLHSNELSSIMHCMNDNKVKMGSISISSQEWAKSISAYRNMGKGFIKEKIMGIFYFNLLRNFTWPESKYDGKYEIIVCNDNSLDINKVLESCKRISGMYNRNFAFQTSIQKFNKILKFADYVAAAHRKLPEKQLMTYKNFRIIKRRPEPSDFIKVFGSYA
ncbi:hypothetical protein D4Q76_02010 [archaeon]|nr:MAG: hypothetical protein D4Q76_02010 [archaeon]